MGNVSGNAPDIHQLIQESRCRSEGHAAQAGHDLDVSVNTYTVPDMGQKHDAAAGLKRHILN
jgi:hypothetical protein